MTHKTTALLAALLATFALQARAEADLFSGVYRPSMQNQSGSFAVQPVGKDKWSISSNEVEGEPYKPFPVPGMPPWTLAANEFINTWFDEASPRDKITCLAPAGSERTSFSICRVPIGTSYQVQEAMSNERASSATGYIYVSGTFAGAMTGDLVRSPR